MKDKMSKMMEMMEGEKPATMSEKDIEAKKDVLKELLAMCDSTLKGKSQKGIDEVRGISVCYG